MKRKRNLLVVLSFVLVVSFLFAGCVPIPEEYTKGVKLDSSYPEDDMPIMDDALVYYCKADDESVTVKYGVSDSLDDVADFYKDHFDDNSIFLSDESDKSSRYTAQGSYMDFFFTLRASAPSGEYEEKLFETVVKIEIEFIDDIVTTPDNGLTESDTSLAQDILGFWRQESFEDSAGKTETYDYGIAYEFLADGTLNLFSDFVYFSAGGWAYVDESTILLTAVDGTTQYVTAVIEDRSGIDYLVWTDSTGILTFFRDYSDEFSMSGTDTTIDDGSQSVHEQLLAALTSNVWYYYHYSDAMSNLERSSSGYEIYYQDGSFEYSFDEALHYGSWYSDGSRIYCSYENGSSSNWEVELLEQRGISFLKYYSDSDPGSYWLYANISRDMIPGDVENCVIYLTDEEMTYASMGMSFDLIYYLYADGTIEELPGDTAAFHEDGSYDEYVDGVYAEGTWLFQDGYLYIYYSDGVTNQFPAFVEYNPSVDSYFMYLGDLEVGYEGGNWVLTDYEP